MTFHLPRCTFINVVFISVRVRVGFGCGVGCGSDSEFVLGYQSIVCCFLDILHLSLELVYPFLVVYPELVYLGVGFVKLVYDKFLYLGALLFPSRVRVRHSRVESS